MREHRQIVERWRAGSASILSTLIRVQGSSYRQVGARLLVCKDGTYEGSVSAGCLEADLLRRAAWLIRKGPAVERYSTAFDEEGEMPFGLGCGGVIDILLEPADTPECEALLKAIESSLAGNEHFVATWLPSLHSELRRAVSGAAGDLVFASPSLSSDDLTQAQSRSLPPVDDTAEGVFIERIAPPQRMYIFGGGDDAKPLVTMACMLGWSVTIVDGRTHLARKSRFPETNAEVLSNREAAICRINSHDAVVIMTHSYEQDRDCLTTVLSLRPRYLGLLGSRRRSSLLITEAAHKLNWSLEECCASISAPAGLGIGGEGPEPIALAILSEAQACCLGKEGTSSKLSAQHVQEYTADSEFVNYAQAQCSLGVG